MKKKFLILTLIGIVVSSSKVFAETQIIPTTNGFNLSVKCTNNKNFDKATLMVFDKESNLLYMDEKKTSEENSKEVVFDSFKLSDNLQSAEDALKIKVRVGSEIKTKVYSFTNPNQRKNDFLAMIGESDYQGVKTRLASVSTSIDFNYQKFLSYTGENAAFQNQICQSILDLGLKEKYRQDLSTGINNVEILITEFLTEMEKIYEAVDIMCSDDLSDVLSNIENANRLTFDKLYFDTKYINKKEDVISGILAHDFEDYKSVNIDKLKEIFCGYTALYVVKRSDWATATAALDHYNKNTTYLNLDYTYYTGLNNTQKSQVFDEMKKDGFTEYSQIASKFLYYSKLASKNSSGDTSSNNKGGSKGGGTNIIAVPTILTEEETQLQNVQKINFPDIDGVSWAHEAINGLVKIGAVEGDEKGLFNPTATITREAFIKIVIEAFGMRDENATADFVDVSKNAWSYSYIASAYNKGIVTGKGNNSFGRVDNITREDAVVILYRIFNQTGNVYETEVNFKDADVISDYAKNAVADMAKNGIINGYDGNFYPKNQLTRAEAVKMIYELYTLEG